MKNRSLILDFYQNRLKDPSYVQKIWQNSYDLLTKFRDHHSYITMVKNDQNIQNNDNVLACVPYSLKDLVVTKDILTTGGSKFLANFVPQYSATVYRLLNEQGCHLIAKDNLDEFGLGGTGCYSHYGVVANPHNKKLAVAGSSSGSAVNVAIGASYFALGTDTGDSVRRPASYCGVVGFKPTYGLFSRYGVLPYAPTMDHVGIIAKYVTDVMLVADKICRYDPLDQTSYDRPLSFDHQKTLRHKMKFVIYKNVLELLKPQYLASFQRLINKLKVLGHTIVFATFDEHLLSYISFVYKVLTYPEGYSNYLSFQGINFGLNDHHKTKQNYENFIYDNRAEAFGHELKRRFILGRHISSSENYKTISKKARQLRTLINEEQLKNLRKGDCVLMPTTAQTAPALADIKTYSEKYDDLLIVQNFLGNPSVAIPYDKIDDMPWSVSVTTNLYEDEKCLQIAQYLEQIVGDTNE